MTPFLKAWWRETAKIYFNFVLSQSALRNLTTVGKRCFKFFFFFLAWVFVRHLMHARFNTAFVFSCSLWFQNSTSHVFDILPFVRYFTPLDWCSHDVTSNNTWYSSIPALLPATQVYNPVMFPWATGIINALFLVLFWSVFPSRDHEIHGWGLPVTWHGKTADSPSDTFTSTNLLLLFLIRGGAGKVKINKRPVVMSSRPSQERGLKPSQSTWC